MTVLGLATLALHGVLAGLYYAFSINVPLNNALDGGRITFDEYTPRWTAFNTVRAGASVASLILVGTALTR